MPFKLNADGRHHIPKQAFKVTNSLGALRRSWAAYDASLRQRGSLTVWVTEEAIAAWTAEPRTTRGGQRHHSPLAKNGVTSSIAERHPEAAIIVPPRTNAVPSDTAATAPTQRDRHLQQIAKHGRLAWQAASGYTKRARAETGMSRFKQVIGDGLRSRTDERRATEVEVAVQVLNRMLELGRPNSVRIA